jgi:antitoxin (DNA-binding transcriptional repressor) of toxin-antitoxin stability system
VGIVIAGELRTIAMSELRDKGRVAVGWVAEGTPVMVFQHGDPSAVLIANEEVQRWIAIERSLSALHGLGVYPELADDTANLGSVVAGRERPAGTGLRRLGGQRREILEIPDTIGITEIQRRLASILDEVGQGRPISIYSSGKYVGVFITPAEYYRLRKLSRVVAWFRTAGLDLATADEGEIADFVRRFREAPGTATGSAVG